jgi:hypothetical protein
MSICGLGLSCEPIKDSFHVCEHSVHQSLPCDLCKLQKQITDLSNEINEIKNILEAWNEDLEYLDLLNLHKRIKKLELKTPHKCPVCEGCGMRPNPLK